MADPISLAVGTAVLNATGSFAVANAVSTAVFWTVTAAPLAIGAVVMEQRASQYRDGLSGLNDDRSLQVAVPEAAPEANVILGYGTLAGRPIFQKGGEDRRPYFYIGRELAWHECDGLDSIFINGTRVYIDGDGVATSVPFNDGTTAFIEVSFRAGTLDQAIDPIIAADFPSVESTFRQRGHCTVFMKAHYGTGATRDDQEDKHRELYGDGGFNPIFRVRGAKVYDPNAIGQSLSDPTTWAWTENRSLNLAWYLNYKFPGFYDNYINWDLWAEAARIDDEWVYTKAGEAIRSNTASGVVPDSQPIAEVIAGLLSAGGGKLVRQASRYYVVPAAKRNRVGAITRFNVRGTIQYTKALGIADRVNEVRCEFFSTERNNRIAPAPVIRVEADVTADGQERPRTVRLPFTERHERAQRNAQRIYNEGRIGETLTLGCDITALDWHAGDVVAVDLPTIYTGALTGEWEILRKAFDGDLRHYVLALRKYDSTVYDFDPQTDEQDFDVEAAIE